ncbi:F-box protein, partial [Mucuna pruriens]
MEDEVDWSELPSELWPKIGKLLESHMDIVRFRSVCEMYRCSIPPCVQNSPSFPMQIPHPFNQSMDTVLKQATVYVIKPSERIGKSKLEPLAASTKGWLIKVAEPKNQHLTLLSPISDRKITHPQGSSGANSPISWNLLDYRVTELCKSYSINNTGRSSAITKVVFFPNSPWIGVEDSMACCIFLEGKLGFMKHGDTEWTLVDDKNFFYDDVIVFKGQLYVTDKWGNISWVDTSSLKLVQFTPPLCGLGNKKHLVESCGSLHVVDRFYENDPPRRRNYVGRSDRDAAVEHFKVYKLDEEWGTWVDVKNLGDRAFVLGNTCSFSVEAKELTGYQGNCIYFTDIFDVRVYNLDDRSILTVDFDPSIDKSIIKNKVIFVKLPI